MTASNPPGLIPLGTQVVVADAILATSGRPGHPAGAVGVVVKAPSDETHAYLVRFADGSEIPLKRRRLRIRKLAQRAGFDEPLREYDLHEHIRDGQEIDLVTHDLEMFMRLMLEPNGNPLEALYSPLVLHTTPEHEELKELGARGLTRWYANHYLGFARKQWQLAGKDDPPRVKPLLYTYRVLLTGIHLMRTGRIEANLTHLLADHPLPGVEELVVRKTGTAEKATLAPGELETHAKAVEELTRELEEAREASELPDQPSSREGLDDLLRRVRLAS